MINYYDNKRVDYKRLTQLFIGAGWKDKTNDPERLIAMVDNSQIVITAWDNDIMVGFARCTTDYVFNGQINNVVVDPEYRGKGIGKQLIKNILGKSSKVTYILRGDSENEEFYKRMGFVEAEHTLIFKRKA